MKIQIGIADDHQLFLKSLGVLINTFPQFEVTIEALEGQELMSKLAQGSQTPDIVLLDVNMPVMDGPKAAEKIFLHYPAIKTVALSMKDDDLTVIRMLKAGCCAYLLKDIHPTELEKALMEVYTKGYYNADVFNINHRRLISKANDNRSLRITEKERLFLQLASTDLTYKEIAGKMCLSERTIDGYRESLFQKLNVKSRVGMALEAIRLKYISL